MKTKIYLKLLRNLFTVFFIISNPVTSLAQNTSYNTNSVPIGGTISTAFGSGALINNTGSRNTACG